jgi:hypothetical protein
VTCMVKKCVDQGHFECRLVAKEPPAPTMMQRLCHKKPKVDPCACPEFETKKVWCPCPVWIECPVTHCERVCEKVPTVCKTFVCKPVHYTETFKVNYCRTVEECKTETYTVLVPKCVPVPCVRKVAICVPCVEEYTVCKMVPVTVKKLVPCAPVCCPAPRCCK